MHDKPDIHLQDLQYAPLHSTVSVKANVGDEVALANGFHTAAAHLVLWEDCVQEFQSQGLSVRSFNFEKFLTKPNQKKKYQILAMFHHSTRR